MMEQENNIISFKEKIKRAIFNRFYLDFISYMIILILGLFLSAIIYVSDYRMYDTFKILAGIGVTILISLMLYILGYLSARKKKGSNKYTSTFLIYVIFFIIYIIATLFYKENANNNFFIEFIQRIKDMILIIHGYLFNWINILCGKELSSEIYVLITPFIMFLGSRRNRKIEIKKMKRKKMMERRNING